MPDRVVSIANRHPRLRIDRRAIAQAIRFLDTSFPSATPGSWRVAPSGELSVVFLTDPALAELHGDFLNDPTPTDVITFEGASKLGTAGEICVSADAASRQAPSSRRGRPAKRRRIGPSAFSLELTLYLVHGWLHLAGYDDLQPHKKRVMRRAEARALRLLTQAEAIPRFILAE